MTGVRLGKRSLNFLDYGKVAATFLNLSKNRAYRIVVKEASRELADALYPTIGDKKERQLLTYRDADESEFFKVESVEIELDDFEKPGRLRKRIICAQCGEGVTDGRDLVDALNRRICRPCAFEGYYRETDRRDGASGNSTCTSL